MFEVLSSSSSPSSYHHHHHHHLAIKELGHLLARSDFTHLEMTLQWPPMVPSAVWFVFEVLKTRQ
jgi:hypothetical protein